MIKAPLNENLIFADLVNDKWARYFSNIDDALKGTIYAGEYPVTTTVKPTRSTAVFYGQTVTLSMVWENSTYPTEDFKITIPNEKGSPTSFESGIILIKGATSNESKVGSAESNILSLPGVSDTRVVATATLILKQKES